MSPSDLTSTGPAAIKAVFVSGEDGLVASAGQRTETHPQGRAPQQTVGKPAHPSAVATVMGNRRCPRHGQIPAVNHRTGPDVLPVSVTNPSQLVP